MGWSFTPNRKILKKMMVSEDICPASVNAREAQLAALRWGLACAYPAGISTAQLLPPLHN